ncbi:MAG: MBL fold metallo-hydrolase [Thermodesulfobacteriota bacterium]|nr:MBL fold metallo-hydrolase [Thermodesulfobacteriota bacterium]
MTIRIATLCENTASDLDFLGEWGLSILIRLDDAMVLLDTGQGRSIVENARAVNVDLTKIDKVVLSHGHIDHTGGLPALLRYARREVKVYAHPEIWGNKLFLDSGTANTHKEFVGIPFQKKYLEDLGASFQLSRKPVWITDRILTTGEISMVTPFEEIDSDFYVRVKRGVEPDPLLDDQALIITTRKGLIVICGCAHRGLINTLIQAQKLTGLEKIYAVLGGTHLYNADNDRISQTISSLKSFGVEKIGVSHCTGMHASSALENAFKEGFYYNHAGTVIEL